MKLKLLAVLSFFILGLAGCGGTTTPTSTTSSEASASPAASAPATTAQSNPNMVEASAEPTATTGGTKEGCKCSAVNMACNTKAGDKGCCGGKDGACTSMRDGIAKCCTSGKDGGSCCSTAKTTAMVDHKDMKEMKDMSGQKTDTAADATTKKS